jgi:two-component system, OmpR family, KDP operon response regulator KdpE
MGDLKKRILIVEDDLRIQEFVSRILVLEGYEVATAETGEDGLQLVINFQPDLILLDNGLTKGLPAMNGEDFMRRYQEFGSIRVPVIIMSAASEAQAFVQQGHADAYLSKPFSLDDLLELVQKHVR